MIKTSDFINVKSPKNTKIFGYDAPTQEERKKLKLKRKQIGFRLHLPDKFAEETAENLTPRSKFQRAHDRMFTPQKNNALNVNSRKIEEEGMLEKDAKSLRNRLLDRPHDHRAIQRLAEVLFMQKDYIGAIILTRKLMKYGDVPGHFLIRMARCFLYKWLTDRKLYRKGLWK